MAALVALIAILDARSAPAVKGQTQTVTADRAISDEEELKAYLGARLGYTITSVKVTELDLVNDLTRATITYQPKDATEGSTPTAVSQISATKPVAAPHRAAAPTAEAYATLDTRMMPLPRTPVAK